MPTYRIWSAEYPEDGCLWEGEAASLEEAKTLASGWCSEGAEGLDGCDATGLPPLMDEEDLLAARKEVSGG